MDRTALNPTDRPPTERTPTDAFSRRVRLGFDRQALAYDHHARLQRAIAWRLAHLVLALPLPEGPAADLGAGTGLVGRSLQEQGWHHRLLQVDASPGVLDQNPLVASHGGCQWDLNRGLPPELADGAGLLISSFALQWLAAPARQLRGWSEALMPGGWLVLAVPTDGSFPEWRKAAARSGVPCTGLPLPDAPTLITHGQRGLQLTRMERLRFSLSCPDGRTFLHQLKAIGAGSSPADRLRPGDLRRLLQHWPSSGVVTWELLLMIGRKGH